MGQQAANAFACYFSSVFLKSKPQLDVLIAQRGSGKDCVGSAARVVIDSVCSSELRLAIRRLKPASAAGPDEIPPFLVKDCYSVLEGPLLYLYNLSLKTSTYAKLWKISRVTPVPKDSATKDVTTYRPIAVLSVFGKVFETIIDHIVTQQIAVQIADVQHGFRAKRSTATNHINFVDYATLEMDAGRQVDSAYFDFSKAFDVVDNDILLFKMAALGFTPKILLFFASYLRDRMQYVRLNGYESDSYYTRSGVSQGSSLGPTLFIIMINDLWKVVNTAHCLLFADDLKLFLGVNSPEDCMALQKDIDAVYDWSMQNGLNFNTTKCKTITFTRRRKPLQFEYHINGKLIDRVEKIKDLGVMMDSQLNFQQHIVSTCERANKILGFVMRVCSAFSGSKAVTMLYKAYVRSRIEYNAIVWNPYQSTYVLLIERIQKKFARYLYKRMYGYYPYLYPSMYVTGMVGLNTLEYRRSLLLMIHYYRLLINKVDNPTTLERIGIACTPARFLVGDESVMGPRRRRNPFALPRGVRSRRAASAPTARAVTLLNAVHAHHTDLDIFFDKPCHVYHSIKLYLEIG